MLHALRSLAALLILFAGAASAAETKPFAREDMAIDAVRLTETLRGATAAIGAQVKGKTPRELLWILGVPLPVLILIALVRGCA